MILPGISGAYILLILGVYSTIIESLSDFQSIIFKFNIDVFINSVKILIFFLIGAILGLKIMSSYISILLKKYPKRTLSFLLGLMLGSVHKIWPWQNKFNSNGSYAIQNKSIVLPNNYDGSPELLKAFLFMGLGCLIFFSLSRQKNSKPE